MASTVFSTENRSYRQMLGNGLTNCVPPFQRDYSWDEEEWEDLWTAILDTISPTGEPAHYMGYLVLQTLDNPTFQIIDGQQRMTTTSLIVLAAMRVLQDFAEKSIKTTQSRNAKIVRYILCRFEKQAGGVEFDAESSSYSIEHVLPQSPASGWDQFDDRDLENSTYRLGNMVMLETGKNKDLGNQAYAKKRDVLKSSGILLTRRLAVENEDWTPSRLMKRQEQMAKMATSVWRIARLSSGGA